MIISSYKKSHIAAFVAAAFVHGGLAAWSLMPSDPVVINQQTIQVSFVAPSASEKKNENSSHEKFALNSERENALKQKLSKKEKSEGKEVEVAGKETSGRVDPNAIATRSAESEPVFNANYLNNPAPYYPANAKRKGIQGKVLLSVLVKIDGTPALVEISHSSGSQDLDLAALDAVKQWKFIPARSRGESVEASVIVPVEFKII
ncbi:MAG: energy transducer TonB [Proteobacteria bacterium]|nr:energy transducer TonB [Pseudomonadota bacterium]